VNLVIKLKARNIAHRYAIFFVLNSVTLPPQYMGNFSRSLEMIQCPEHKPFADTVCFLKEEPLLKLRGDDTTRVRELVRSDRRLKVGTIAD
jgi:hypothetical protein